MSIQRLKTEDYISSTDLALVAAIALFYPIEAIDRRNPQKAEFLFKRDKQLEKLIETFWRGEMRVSPQAYFYQLKLIKTRLFETR